MPERDAINPQLRALALAITNEWALVFATLATSVAGSIEVVREIKLQRPGHPYYWGQMALLQTLRRMASNDVARFSEGITPGQWERIAAVLDEAQPSGSEAQPGDQGVVAAREQIAMQVATVSPEYARDHEVWRVGIAGANDPDDLFFGTSYDARKYAFALSLNNPNTTYAVWYYEAGSGLRTNRLPELIALCLDGDWFTRE